MLWIINLALSIIVLFAGALKAQNITVQLKNELTIGDDESAPAEYLFAWPTNVCTDTNNNIYISDKNMSKIRVFDEKGNFLNYISRKGQGPGEIQDLISMVVDKKNDLIVVDRVNHRITRFKNMGKDFETYRIPIYTPVTPWHIYSLGKDNYVLYFHIRSNNKYRVGASDKVLHVFDEKFSLIKESFARADEMWDINDSFLRTRVGKSRSNICVSDSNIILCSPGFYEGKICVYQKKSNKWEMKYLEGKKPENGSYRLLDLSDYSNFKYPGCSIVASGPGYKFLAQMSNISR